MKKSGGGSQTSNYYGTMAGAICMGPTDALVSIIMNGQEMWPQGQPWSVGANIIAGNLYVFNAQTWTCTTNHVASAANAPGSGLEGWTEYFFARGGAAYNDFSLTDSQGVFWGVYRHYWGTQAQTVDHYLQSAYNTAGDQHPDYKGICYCVLIDFCLGQEIQSGPNVEVVVRRGANNQTIVVGGPAAITDGQVNLAAAAAEIIVDPNCVGQAAAIVDSASFQAAANYLDGGNQQPLTGASVLIDSNDTLRSVFDRFLAMIDGYTRYNPNSKKIEMGVYQHGVIPGTYATLTADDLTARPKFSTTSWQGTYSRATVRFNSRQLNYQQTSDKADDPRAFAVLGAVRETSLDRPYIARDSQAIIHGRETLRVVGHAQITGELQVRREFGRTIRAGGYVYVDVDIEPGNAGIGQFFRVTQKKTPATGPITLSIMADNTLATVPWNNSSDPKLVSNPAVNAVANFRMVEVPTVLSGERGAVAPLVQRPDNTIVGVQLFFDTNPAGTFTSLGNFTGFAAKAVLHANAAATDATITVDVDTTQPDANYFTNSYSAIEQANDTMLAVLVSLVTAGGDTGQIIEAGGYQVMEIMSVGTQTLVAAGRYTLSVLRSRQNTTAQAFPAASSEVWMIPRSVLTAFTNANFDTIRANRLTGNTPAYAQFRFAPYTFVTQLALSSAVSKQFRFPLNSISAPSLSLTAPAWFANALSVAFPYSLQVQGTWSDPDQNLVEVQIQLWKSTDTAPRIVFDKIFAPQGSYTLNNAVQFDSAGTWTVKLIARDSNNLTTEVDLAVTLTAAGAAPNICAGVDMFDRNGDPVMAGLPPNTIIQQFIPYGPITLKCATPASTIWFYTSGLILLNGVVRDGQYNAPGAGGWAGWQIYSANCQPFHAPYTNANGINSTPLAYYTLQFITQAAGVGQNPTNGPAGAVGPTLRTTYYA